MFTAEVGTTLDPSNFRRTLNQLTAKADIGHWTPYQMRHTTITLASAAGVAKEHLADLAGHSDTRMVMSTYRHATGPSYAACRLATALGA